MIQSYLKWYYIDLLVSSTWLNKTMPMLVRTRLNLGCLYISAIVNTVVRFLLLHFITLLFLLKQLRYILASNEFLSYHVFFSDQITSALILNNPRESVPSIMQRCNWIPQSAIPAAPRVIDLSPLFCLQRQYSLTLQRLLLMLWQLTSDLVFLYFLF